MATKWQPRWQPRWKNDYKIWLVNNSKMEAKLAATMAVNMAAEVGAQRQNLTRKQFHDDSHVGSQDGYRNTDEMWILQPCVGLEVPNSRTSRCDVACIHSIVGYILIPTKQRLRSSGLWGQILNDKINLSKIRAWRLFCRKWCLKF